MAAVPAGPRTDLDLEHFRQLLEAERNRLLGELRRLTAQEEAGGTAGETSELADYDQHDADQATELFFRERDQAIHFGLQQELNQVNQAWELMEQGRYGYCTRCGAAIPEERLEILPFALYCVACASEIESRF